MSGGRFGYNQYRISEIADTIESVINRNGREKTKEELKNEGWRDSDWYKKYPEDLYYYKYPDEVIEKFKIAVKLLREAYVYAHRIDWLLSGDDGEDSFIERLKKDLKRNHEYSGVIKSTEYEFTPSTPTEPLATEARDTVAAGGHIHKWHDVDGKEWVCYMCGKSKTDERKSSEGQP